MVEEETFFGRVSKQRMAKTQFCQPWEHSVEAFFKADASTPPYMSAFKVC